MPYRTKAIAEKSNDLVPCPERLAVPTLQNYEHSISLHQDGKAFLQKLTMSTDGLQFENGEMFFEGDLEPISTVKLQDMRTNEGIEEIDIPLLTMYYTIILAEYSRCLRNGETIQDVTSKVTTIYAPELARCLGIIRKGEDGGLHKSDIANIMAKTRKFHNILGIMHITRNGKPDESYFPVLTFAGYDAEDNTISFISPYLRHIVRKIYSASIKLDKKGNPKVKRNGQPMLYPNNSYLVKSSIASERNEAAVANVFIIVQLIEQAGDKGIPNIKASTIIERNEFLKLRLQNSSNPAQLLKRAFKKTWQLLRDQTILLEVYDSIVLPNPKDISKIPTPGNLDNLVFRFPHKGKKKR